MSKCDCSSLNQLEGSDALTYKRKLDKIAATDDSILRRCTECLQYWNQFFSDTDQHGSGSCTLLKISSEEAKSLFGNIA